MTRDEHCLTRMAAALNEIRPGWSVRAGTVVGPDGASAGIEDRGHSDLPHHLDIWCRLKPDDGPLLWDCVNGFGASPSEAIGTAIHLWSQTTAMALLELKYSRRREFADHYRGNERDGLPGWHVIAAPILGFGKGDSPDALQRWCIEHPLLPELGAALSDVERARAPHGMKVLFGGADVAEVRLGGERHEAASQALLRLEWPRLADAGFVRTYFILVHPE